MSLSTLRLDRWHLRQHIPEWIVCQLSNAILAIVSAAIGALLGPTLFVMMRASDPMPIPLTELLGQFWGSRAVVWVGIESVGSRDLLGALPYLLFGLAAVRLVASAAQNMVWEYASEKVSWHIRQNLFQDFLSYRPNVNAAKHADADIAGILANDVKVFREYFVHYFGSLPREILQLIIFFGMLFTYSVPMTLIFLVGITPVIAVVSRLGKKLRKRAEAALNDFSQLSEWLQLRLNGIETIKHFATERVESNKMREYCDQLFKTIYRALRVKSRSGPILELVAVLSISVVFYVAFKKIQAGEISGSVQMSFFATLALISQAGGRMGKYLNANREGVAAMRRILNAQSELKSSAQQKLPEANYSVKLNESHKLQLQNVSYRYPGAAEAAVDKVSYGFSPSKIYCIVGASGSGKSTLFKLMLGLQGSTEGKIIVGGETHRSNLVGFVPQKTQLAVGSIAENIAYPDQAVEKRKVDQSLEAVGLADWIKDLPDQQDAKIGSDGHGVSGGQAQRISLARMWYHDYQIALIDEGTSAADPETERRLIQSMRALSKIGCCVVTIAHRQAVAAAADEILVLSHGKLVRSGSYAELQRTSEFRAVFGEN